MISGAHNGCLSDRQDAQDLILIIGLLSSFLRSQIPPSCAAQIMRNARLAVPSFLRGMSSLPFRPRLFLVCTQSTRRAQFDFDLQQKLAFELCASQDVGTVTVLGEKKTCMGLSGCSFFIRILQIAGLPSVHAMPLCQYRTSNKIN